VEADGGRYQPYEIIRHQKVERFSRVVLTLTVNRLNFVPEDNRRENLMHSLLLQCSCATENKPIIRTDIFILSDRFPGFPGYIP
jgi:hypothetical protein